MAEVVKPKLELVLEKLGKVESNAKNLKPILNQWQ